MDKRELMQKALRGEQTGSIAFSPRLEIWYEYHQINGSLPEKYKNSSLRDIERELKVIHPGRQGKVHTESVSVGRRKKTSGNSITYCYDTPYGTLSETFVRHQGETRISHKERLWKSPADYDALRYLIESIEYHADYNQYRTYDDWVGENGTALVNAGEDPFYELLRYYMGFEEGYSELVDNENQFLSLLTTLSQKKRELQDIILQSPGEFIIHGQHYDSQLTPQPIYREYIGPYLSDFASRLHASGKRLAIHADADSSRLLEDIKDSGVDIAECFCSYPMVPCRLDDALAAWAGSVVIWGGIPSTLLVPQTCELDVFEKYVQEVFDLLDKYDYTGLILGIADNVMPEADIARVEYIAREVNALNCRSRKEKTE